MSPMISMCWFRGSTHWGVRHQDSYLKGGDSGELHELLGKTVCRMRAMGKRKRAIGEMEKNNNEVLGGEVVDVDGITKLSRYT